MALFEGYERRINQVNAFLAKFGLDARAVSDTLSFKRAKPL